MEDIISSQCFVALRTIKIVLPGFHQRKRSAHERQNEGYHTGEWSSGKKWNDDAPKEEVSEDSVLLMSSGTCGAFVHGLEDEFLG